MQQLFPLKDESGVVLAVLTVSISRGGMVEAQQHIRAIAYGVAAGGILLAIAEPVDRSTGFASH